MNYYRRHLGDYARGWHAFDPMLRHEMPRLPACYVVLFDGRAVYVGQTSDLRGRFADYEIRHGYGRNIITPWAEVSDTVRVLVKAKFAGRYGEWAMRELRLIARLQPPFNIHHKRRRAA